MAEELPLPVCKFFLTCVTADSTPVGGLSLLGVSDKVLIWDFTEPVELCFVLWLSRASGVCDLRAEVRDSDQRLVCSVTVKHVEFGGTAERKPVVFKPGKIGFQKPGKYEVRAMVGGAVLETIALLVEQAERPDLL